MHRLTRFCTLLLVAVVLVGTPARGEAMNEPIRGLTDWLRGDLKDHLNVDQGIAAQLTKLTAAGLVDVGDVLPTVLKANIVDETRDNEAARRAFNKDRATPLVVVLTPNDFAIAGEVQTVHTDADAYQMLVGWLVKAPGTAAALTQVYYGMRATRRSLGQWHKNENQPKRKRNDILLWQCREIRHVRPQEALGDLELSAGLLLTYALRDGQPH